MVAEPSTTIDWFVLFALNEYQTSSSAVPANPLQVAAACDCVAPTVVPAVVVQAVFTDKLVAPMQKSFATLGTTT